MRGTTYLQQGKYLPLVLALTACGQDYNVVHQPPDVNPEDVTPCPFSEIPGTQFQRYDCNPVFTNTDEDWVKGGVGSIAFHAEVVLGQPIYQMWYATGLKGGVYGLGYAISAEGTVWEPLPANPVFADPGSGWNKDSMGAVTVVWDGDAGKYVMAYQGVNFTSGADGLGIISSTDGQDWQEEHGGEPFLDMTSGVGGVKYCWPLSLTWESGIGYQGYINGAPANPPSDICQVYGYGGKDLEHLDPENGGPILKAGPKAYDQKGTASAAVVRFEDTYYMFYTGIREWQPIQGTTFITPKNTTLNLATSTDGVHFTKSEDNPILQISLVDDPYQIGNVAAQVVGSRIHLWIDDYYDDVGTSAVGYFLFDPHADKY